MAIKGVKCPSDCTCRRHQRAKCLPGCTCWRHNPSPAEVARLRAMSANRLGKRSSDEHRRRISQAHTGKPLSEEHRRKVAAINADPELSKRKAESRKARRKPPETHRQVHKRLVRDRGHASDYPCADCSGQAGAWSYGWRTWEDVAQEIHGKRVTFSTNLAEYQPRCHACHNQLDRNWRAWDAAGVRPGAKLTESDVSWIRTCGLGSEATARALGINRTTVHRIRCRKSWRDVP